MVNFLQGALDESFHILAKELILQPPSEDLFGPLDRSELIDAWFATAFTLLRDAREGYDGAKWKHLHSQVDQLILRAPQHSDRSHYESALWAVWNIDRREAKQCLARWQPSSQSPQAALWKASLLAEVRQLAEAKALLRSALQETQGVLRSKGRNIELLSLEGWCTYLLFAVETAEPPFHSEKRRQLLDEFSDRWQELKAWDCSPWTYKEYFDEVLAGPPPRPPLQERIISGFDPGRVTVSYHLGGDSFTPLLPAFAYIRLFEKVGIPLRMPTVNIAGDALTNACRWIAPFANFLSFALLIRAGETKVFEDQQFLSRTRVAAMDESLVKRMYDWCFTVFAQQIKGLSSLVRPDPWSKTPIPILAEVLSRLAFRMDQDSLRSTFPLVLSLYLQPDVLHHYRLQKSIQLWFGRLITAADDELLFEWLPPLISAPLSGGRDDSEAHNASLAYDPMVHLQDRAVCQKTRAQNYPKIIEAVTTLAKTAAAELGDQRRRALVRLVLVYRFGLMNGEQESRLGELLWAERTPANLPDVPLSSVSFFSHLPHPPGLDVNATTKSYILSLGAAGSVSRDPTGNMTIGFGGQEQPLILEASNASKPIIHLSDEPQGEIEWTVQESRQLFQKVKQWWANDKPAIQSKVDLFGAMRDSQDSARRLGEFLSRVVLPYMQEASQSEWQDVLLFMQEIRQCGFFPDVAMPYVLLHRPAEYEEASQTILSDLEGDVEDAVAAAAGATRHWIHLAASAGTPVPPADLLGTLIERVCFRRKTSITSCLWHLASLVAEKPDSITPIEAALLTSSLKPWDLATLLPMPESGEGDFVEAERPNLRVYIAKLAYALEKWHEHTNPGVPVPAEIEVWREACSRSPLPEIRRAWNT
jgi:hypothetical protein